MPLHRQTADLLAMMASLDLPPIEETTPQEARAQRAAMLRPSPEPIAECRDLDAGGVPCRFYRPAVVRSPGLLVWYHGGGWVLGDLDSHDDPCRSLANRGGCCVLSVGYRLAPEDPFPAAVDDALAATRWAGEHLADLGCRVLAIGGDSAGGNLAAVVANQRRRRSASSCSCTRRPMPAWATRRSRRTATATSSPLPACAGSSTSTCPVPMARWRTHACLPLLEDPERLAAGPPAMVVTAEFDPLRDEGAAYALALAEAGVPTTHVRVDGQIHGFFSLFGLVDDARSAQSMAAEALHTAFTRAANA